MNGNLVQEQVDQNLPWSRSLENVEPFLAGKVLHFAKLCMLQLGGWM